MARGCDEEEEVGGGGVRAIITISGWEEMGEVGVFSSRSLVEVEVVAVVVEGGGGGVVGLRAGRAGRCSGLSLSRVCVGCSCFFISGVLDDGCVGGRLAWCSL